MFASAWRSYSERHEPNCFGATSSARIIGPESRLAGFGGRDGRGDRRVRGRNTRGRPAGGTARR